METTAKKLLADIKARKFEPVYFLQGEETYFIDVIANALEETVLTESEKGFNQVIVYGKDVTVPVILTHARRFPMMSEQQLVLVREAQDIPDLNKETGVKLLLDYFSKPVPSTVLIFCHKHKTLDKRRTLGNKIAKLVTTLTAKKLYENQLPDFIHEYFRDRRVPIDEKAVQVLAEFVGNDLSRLSNEMDKLLISYKGNESISAETVMSHVGISKEYNIFELQKAIIQGDVFLANKIAHHFEQNTKKNPIIPVVAFLFSFFSKLLVASQLPDKNEKNMASSLKLSPYAVRDYSVALRKFSSQKILQTVSLLKETDLKLKGVESGSEPDGRMFRELVYRIMH